MGKKPGFSKSTLNQTELIETLQITFTHDEPYKPTPLEQQRIWHQALETSGLDSEGEIQHKKDINCWVFLSHRTHLDH